MKTKPKHSPTGRVQPDMTKRQFLAVCKRLGFEPQGFMGYVKTPSGVHVSVHNTNTTRRRTWLAYLIQQNTKHIARAALDSKAEVALRAAGCILEARGKEHGWWKGEAFLGHGHTPADALDTLVKIGRAAP